MAEGKDRKRLIKAARKVPVENILALLQRHEDLVDDYFLVYNSFLDCWFIRCWSRTNGMMDMTIEEEALGLACIEYMKSHGYLVFESEMEASTYVKARGWACSRSLSLERKLHDL